MKRLTLWILAVALVGFGTAALVGCGKEKEKKDGTVKKDEKKDDKTDDKTKKDTALTIGYSDWPGWLVWEIAKQKDFFKDAGVSVKLEWFEQYSASIDAFAAGKLNGLLVVCGDALPIGGDMPSTAIVLTDYSNGNDMIIGKAGIKTFKDLKGKKVGVEHDYVEHILLAEALKQNEMKDDAVTVENIKTEDTPAALKTGKVDAIGAWYPISGRALKEVTDSKALFTSKEAPGLIYDGLHVNRESLELRRDDWKKVVGVWFKCLKFLKDEKTHDEAVKIMATKIKAKPEDLEKNLAGTKLLDRKANLEAMDSKDEKLDGGVYSVYGSLKNADEFYIKRKLPKYKSREIKKYIDSDLVKETKE